MLNIIYALLRNLFKTNLLSRYGQNSYALITGSTDGIGKEFAIQLTKRGFNIILAARNEIKLQKVKVELQKINPKIDVQIIVADFCQAANEQFFDKIDEQIKKYDISILVNNVGTDNINAFLDQSTAIIKDIMVLNTFPIVFMTKIIINKMLSRQLKSGIINLSSSSAIRPLPNFSVYGATKIFDDFFSRSLSIENGGKLDIISVQPGYVQTPLTHYKKPSFDTVTTEECVNSVLLRLGWERQTCGHWKHNLQKDLIQLVPDWLFNFLTPIVTGMEKKRRQKID